MDYAACMFQGRSSITEIDLTNFDDSRLLKIHYMFEQCSSLKKIEISNIKANKVNDAGLLFRGCSLLESINLANFNPQKNIFLHYMFSGCSSLISLNFPNFNVVNAQKIVYFFTNCNKLKYINFENAIIDNGANLESNFLKSNQIICTHSPKLISIIQNVGATLSCENNYCISQTEGDDCFELDYRYQYKNIYYENCPSGAYNDNYNCKDCEEKCSLCSKESTDKNLCLSCNNRDNYYKQHDNSQNSDSSFMECLRFPKGFYFDSTNSVYKPCYSTCASCDKDGNDQNNNCIECNDDYKFELNLNNYINCYSQCPNFFYEEVKNNNIKYKRTKERKCPNEYNKLIPDIGKCIDKCGKDNNYKYEYRNECLNDCPTGTIPSKNEVEKSFYCKPKCNKETPFEIIREQKCIKYCTVEELNKKMCILNYIEEKSKRNSLIKYLEMFFTSKYYDYTKIEQGEEEIYQDETFSITLTSVDNQKNNINNNMTRINLTQCEIELRKFYNLSEDKILFLRKIDININGMRIPKVLFDIYYKVNETNLVQINLFPCKKVKIELIIPIKISENLDEINTSSGYFNDICYVSTSERGTDISLEDRKKNFIEGNKTICQENCVFSEYDYENQRAKCLCKEKGFEAFFDNMKIDKNKLYDNFIDIKNIINIKILKCYDVLINIKGIIKNICFYIIGAIILFHIITIIIFYTSQKNLLNNKIKEIFFAIRNWELVKQNRSIKISSIKPKRIFLKKNFNSNGKKEV